MYLHICSQVILIFPPVICVWGVSLMFDLVTSQIQTPKKEQRNRIFWNLHISDSNFVSNCALKDFSTPIE